MKTKSYIRNWLVAIFLSLQGLIYAQNADQILQQLVDEDRASIEALVMYPEDTRNDILTASQHPELIVRISEMQKMTSQEFVDLLEPYSQEDQVHFWELARYPDLVNRMAGWGGLKESDLKDFPESVHDDARWADANHPHVVKKMDDLYGASDNAFNSILSGYSGSTQQAFRNLVALPEVMDILSKDLKMTVLMGDLYQRDPQMVRDQLNALSVEVARRNAQELEAWRDSLEANPQALKEFQESAEEFRNTQPAPIAQPQEVVEYTTVVEYYDPYPWWFGYPVWYDYPMWYPYPYWYHWGFYYGAGGAIVVNWLPSAYYTNWYFYNPYHHYHYPYFTDFCIGYNYYHRQSPGGFHHVTGGWVSQNQAVFGRNWLYDDPGRVSRIREYGKFETDYHNAVVSHPNRKPMSQQAYFDAHSQNYPNLKASVNASPKQAMQGRPTKVSRSNEMWPTTKPAYSGRPTSPTKGGYKPKLTTQPRQIGEPRGTVQPNDLQGRQDGSPRATQPRGTYNPKGNVQPAQSKGNYTPKGNVQPRQDMRPQQRNVAPVQPPRDMQPKGNYNPKYDDQPRQRDMPSQPRQEYRPRDVQSQPRQEYSPRDMQSQPRQDMKPEQRYDRPREDVRPRQDMQQPRQMQPKGDYNPKGSMQPRHDMQQRQVPRMERPQQRDYNPAPSYHRDSWQRGSPQPNYAPRPSMAPRGGQGPKGR
jgi:hypothetical protein